MPKSVEDRLCAVGGVSGQNLAQSLAGIALRIDFPMRAVFERFPVAAPCDRDTTFLRRPFDDRRKAMVVRPVPRDFPVTITVSVEKRCQIDRVTRQVTAIHRLRRTLSDKLALTLDRAQAFKHGEVNVTDFDGALHHADKIRMNAFETVERGL